MAEYTDIAPALLARLQDAFAEKLEHGRAAALHKSIQAGEGGYTAVEEYAAELGEALAEVLREQLTSAGLPDGRLYYNIADRVLRPLLQQDRTLVSDAAVQALNTLNTAAGIGLKAQPAPENESRVQDLVQLAADAEVYDEVAGTVERAAVTYSQSVADDTLKHNVEFMGKAGLRPRIIRTATSHCCEWCQNLAHTYEYPVENEDVYRRHADCRCTVEYVPQKGKRKNVHTKPQKNGTIKTKYAPSPQRQRKGIQLPPKKYAKLCGELGTRYPDWKPEDGDVVIRDANYKYVVRPDGYGGFSTLSRTRIK